MALPLDGISVVELSSLVAGPAMGALLHELGADVIKVEQPEVGDMSRTVSPWGFLNYNYGKKSLSLNLKSVTGQKILHRLIGTKKHDIFIENMGADVPKRLGFSYSILRKINPNLIYCSIKGFSSNTRYYHRPAFDAVAQAMSGMMSLTGGANGEPARVGNPSVDLGAAAYGTIEVLGAVLQQQRFGATHRKLRGKFIEVSLLDMSVYWNGYWLAYYGITGNVPQRLGSGHLGYSPHRVFRTKDQKYVLIATLSDEHWRKLTTLLDIKLGSNFNASQYRLSHRLETEKAVAKAVVKMTSEEVFDRLGEFVPCSPVRTVEEIYNDEELYKSGVLRDIENPFRGSSNGKTVRIAPRPVSRRRLEMSSTRMSKTVMTVPTIGQDNEQILRSIGYSQREIDVFKQSGVL